MTRPLVELHPAHVWTCDECGRDNFVRAIRYEPLEQELPGLLDAAGISREDYDEWTADPDNSGLFTSIPASVACEWCGAEFEVDDE